MRSSQRCPWGLDPSTPSVARIYDYFLGGKDNFAVDRAAAAKVVAVFPGAPVLARENRRFAARAAWWCAKRGIDQFLDVGTGLPTVSPEAPSLFTVVPSQRPQARIVGVDNDPVVLSHDRALLETGTRIRIIDGDIRWPDEIFDRVDGLVYTHRPVAVFLVALLHLLTEAEDPRGVVAAMVKRLAPGSLVVISHVTSTGCDPDAVKAIEEVYSGASSPVVFRTAEEILDLVTGLELLEPGLVDVADWRPDGGDGEVDPLPVRVLGAVARVPEAAR
jgi:hypothetical protein